MARYPVTLQAVFDDVAKTVTLTGMAPPPPPPADFKGQFIGQTGPGFEATVPVSKKDLTPNPTAIYIVPNSEPVEKRLVEYKNGAWQMPGTVVVE